MSVTVLIPVKSLATAKGRLAEVLAPPERQALVALMLAKVVAAVRAAPGVDAVNLISPEEWPALGVRTLKDTAGELNAALEAGVAGLDLQAEDIILILSGDLPWLQPPDVEAMVEAARSGALAVARDLAGAGTNGLAFRRDRKPRFAFGLESCARHRDEAAALGVPCTVLDRPGLAFDVDDAKALARMTARSD